MSGRRRGLFTQVTIHIREGDQLWFTGFSAKRMQDWLRRADVEALWQEAYTDGIS